MIESSGGMSLSGGHLVGETDTWVEITGANIAINGDLITLEYWSRYRIETEFVIYKEAELITIHSNYIEINVDDDHILIKIEEIISIEGSW